MSRFPFSGVLAVALVVAFALAAAVATNRGGAGITSEKTQATSVARAPVSCAAPSPCGVWQADHEEGTLSDWYYPARWHTKDAGGGEYDSGSGRSRPSRAYVHSGRWAVEQTIDADVLDPTSGTRLFRWREPNLHDALYYSVWYYFPARITIEDGYFNAFQFKSSDAEHNDPLWVLDIENRPNREMYFRLSEWRGRNIGQSVANIPVRRWVQIQAYYKISTDGTGRIVVWQDGKRLFDLTGVRTAYPYCCNAEGNAWSVGWSVNAYGRGFRPRQYVQYVDDAIISTRYIRPSRRAGNGSS